MVKYPIFKTEIVLKAIREKKIQVTCKGKPFRTIADFSVEALKARRAWSSGPHGLRA